MFAFESNRIEIGIKSEEDRRIQDGLFQDFLLNIPEIFTF